MGLFFVFLPSILNRDDAVATPGVASGSNSGGSKPHSIMNQGKPIARDDIVNPNRLKIMGGTMRGRKIDSPDVYLRPMMAKVRMSVHIVNNCHTYCILEI